MSLRTLSRKIRMDILQQEGDICEMLFNNGRAQRACHLLLEEIKENGGLTRHEFSQFAFRLAGGEVEAGFYYSRTRFYTTVRKTLLTLGLIGIQQRAVDADQFRFEPKRKGRRGVVDKYVAVRQPIAKRPPDGLNLVRFTWIICDNWNREFFPDFVREAEHV